MYGLIGEKLGHSFSKEIHAQIADYKYDLCELTQDQVSDFLTRRDFKAVNVTIPYKETVIPLLDEISETAQKIGAVNTIVNRGGKLFGDNTDYSGAAALIRHAGIEIEGKKVLILGTGGTSKTMHAVVRDLKAKSITHVSRRSGNGAVSYAEAISQYADTQVIINTTPVGMYPQNSGCPINIEAFSHLEGVIDVIYNPLATCLIQHAKERHIKASGGLYMLAAQAVYASALFTDSQATVSDIDRVYQAVLREKQNIVLIGMPSCGKSTVGHALSVQTGRRFYDTDTEITRRTQKEIPAIFAQEGEAAFRQTEHDIVEELSKQSGVIISTGGGTVLDAQNIKHLSQNGILFFLDRPLAMLTATDNRPLSSDAKSLQKRYDERYPIYTASADVHIKADGSVEEVANLVKEAFFA